MNDNQLNNLSYEIYSLMIYIHDKLFDPREIAKSSSLPPSYIKVLFYLFKVGSSPISKVACDLGISKSNMTPIIDNLLDKNFIIRYNDKNDRRIHRVELSDSGRDFIKAEEIRASKSISKKICYLESEDLESLKNHVCQTKNILSKVKKADD